MSLRNAPTRARQQAAYPTSDPAGVGACRATPSLLEELAVDAHDFADLARVLKVDLPTVVMTLAATRPTTVEALVAHLRGEVATASPATPPDAPVASDDPFASVRELGGAIAARLANATSILASIGRRVSITPWGGEDGRGSGRWTRTRGTPHVQRSGSDHAAGPTASAAAVSP